MESTPLPLSPRPVRIAVYLVLVLIAVASIWLIDRRAMIVMQRNSIVAAQPGH